MTYQFLICTPLKQVVDFREVPLSMPWGSAELVAPFEIVEAEAKRGQTVALECSFGVLEYYLPREGEAAIPETSND